MTNLKGWSGKPLPKELETAIEQGAVTIHADEKGKYEYLKGKFVNKDGVIVEFR